MSALVRTYRWRDKLAEQLIRLALRLTAWGGGAYALAAVLDDLDAETTWELIGEAPDFMSRVADWYADEAERAYERAMDR